MRRALSAVFGYFRGKVDLLLALNARGRQPAEELLARLIGREGLDPLADTSISFVLTSGGHNAGIVSEPGHPHRSFRISERAKGERYVDPETWVASTPAREGSWWTAWAEWLARHSSSLESPPAMGAPAHGYPTIGPAPGRYVLRA